jgi:Mrp family chromosome partitioning ATPase
LSQERRRADQASLKLVVGGRPAAPSVRVLGRGGASGRPAETTPGTIPIIETLPVFEEEGSTPVRPGPVIRNVLEERSLAAEQFRLLATRMRALARDKRLRRLGVVSAARGEGRTTVALGLAQALARGSDERVLLLEFDLRHPSIDRSLGLSPPAVGLRRFLESNAQVPVLRHPDACGFWILSGGRGAIEKPHLVASPRMASLLRAIDRVFDYVVVDCPPLLPVADSVLAQDLLDGVVFVVRARQTPRETIVRAHELLDPSRVAGLLLNAQHDLLPSRREYAHRRYEPR